MDGDQEVGGSRFGVSEDRAKTDKCWRSVGRRKGRQRSWELQRDLPCGRESVWKREFVLMLCVEGNQAAGG